MLFVSVESAPQEQAVAVLINNDPSQRHVDNIIAAQNACMQKGIQPIIIAPDTNGAPTRKQIIQTLETIGSSEQRLAFVYLTGHGILLFNGSEKPSSSIHFKDGPLVADDITSRLGSGPNVIYIDVCFASGWMNDLDRSMQGQYLLLSDKPLNAQQRSCRGVSTELWRLVENSDGVSLPVALLFAWKQTCPDGVCVNHLCGSTCSLF